VILAPVDCDVLIIGAGPVGLALGCALQLHGVQVHVLEARQAPLPTARASHVHGRVLELLDGLGVTEALQGRPTWGARIWSDSRPLVEFRSDGLPCVHPYSLAVPQPEVEAALEVRLLALGGRVSRGVRVEGVEAQGAVHVDGSRLLAPWVVGCDGAASTARASLGLDLPGQTLTEPLALADFDTAPEDRLEVAELHCGPRGIVFRVPLRDGERVVIDQPPPGPEITAAQVAEIAASRVGALPLGQARWASSFRLHRRVAPRWQEHRVLLAGDAVHLHSPVGGQGMNAGLLDALHLGWRLAAVLRGAASEAALERWARERSAGARDSVNLAWAASRALRLRRGPLPWARDTLLSALGALPFARARMAGWGVALDNDAATFWARQLGAPPGTVGARAPSAPGPGRLMPGELGLVGFSARSPLELAPRLAARFGRPVQTAQVSGSSWGDPPADWLALVRPDGIVAYRGSVAGLSAALEGMLGG
jgi:2-polyprenyl-6-methoxyphenol hydroxylase-like FAD-dependent oxidoreductase